MGNGPRSFINTDCSTEEQRIEIIQLVLEVSILGSGWESLLCEVGRSTFS